MLIESFETEVLGMGTPKGEYPGQFSPIVESIIKHQIVGYSEVLHLFSGASTIGGVRVDIMHPNATHQMDVVSFLEQDHNDWSFTILDPPYAIERKNQKLSAYGRVGDIGGNTAMRLALNKWAVNHTWRVLWLDQCAPMLKHFRRVKLWFLLPGGFANIRVLSLLENGLKKPSERATLDKYWLKSTEVNIDGDMG